MSAATEDLTAENQQNSKEDLQEEAPSNNDDVAGKKIIGKITFIIIMIMTHNIIY